MVKHDRTCPAAGWGWGGGGRGPSFRHRCPSSQKENDVMKVVILEDYSLGWKVRLEMQGRLPTCVKLLPRAEYLSRRCLQIPSVCLPLKRHVSRCPCSCSSPLYFPFSLLFLFLIPPHQTILLLRFLKSPCYYRRTRKLRGSARSHSLPRVTQLGGDRTVL